SEAESGAPSMTLKEVQEELRVAAQEVETLQSDIVQEKHLQMLSETLESRGKFIFARPDKLRWEMLEPIASGFVLSGDTGTRWNALSEEVEDFSIESDPVMEVVAQQLLAWARVDMEWLKTRYTMEVVEAEPVTLRLVPRDPAEAEMIESLTIVFDPQRSHVAEVVMQEQGGDWTRMRFTHVEVNAELRAHAFQAPEF
ncbi:MAG: outer membrane lipoprotein carrier protein LolA, partial [Geobacteraceae bacterium]|nr:outer membrane lipoprotein carrier protein LolA [Geobacteraceae bacterium]